ncbi:DUF4175 domain-containing protein [Sphingoaurantiacus capsulatus]|uniref:DUF4175 domain-containing protein n=1 Tax=Sphingoaurantiacus capsulatus TaxID=1771310 RepID=A0ABV7XFJ4_9SPHN
MSSALPIWLRPSRVRSVTRDALLGIPLVLAAAALAWRLSGSTVAMVVAAIGIVALALAALLRAQRYDDQWLVRRLDTLRPDAEDSAGLLLADPATLGPLQRLQRERLEQRLSGEDGAALRPAWRGRVLAAAWAGGVAVVLLALLLPSMATPPELAPAREGIAPPPGVPRLVAQRLSLDPPAYTGLPARSETRLDARAPQGSQVGWRLRFDPQPATAAILFHDGRRLALRRNGDEWTASHRLDRSALYRVVPTGGEGPPLPPLHRLDATPDAPPRLRVIAPERSVTLLADQADWPLLFEATDDYAVAPTASLRVTVTEGEGENISFKERLLTLSGSGEAKRRRFAIRLDPRQLALARGNDIVAQLTIRDLRRPASHVVRGPSVILRWPKEMEMAGDGIEGMMRKTLPAYFRSQRQIIIDAEKLLRERRQLSADTFLERSDKLGVDQRLLRLRYGQFLGEVSEGEPEPPPTNDAPATGEEAKEGHSADDGHDHGGSASSATGGTQAFGNAGDVMGAYGHTHDESEAATLIDPETRAILKKALDEMWQSELHLRQGDPKQALPFAYKALAFIKQVQQSQRIYLARVGPELPPIDETRRMTGKREGIERRPLPPLPPAQVDAAPARAWAALAGLPGREAPPLDALELWLRANEAKLADPLALVAAIDAVRQEPNCTSCRARLRGLLWTAMPRPTAQVPRRDAGDAAGRRYLDALRGGE